MIGVCTFIVLDSLRYTSALSVGLAIVFVVITAGVAIVKTIDGSISMPRLLPEISNQASFWKLFTTFPVLVTAYICHHNSTFLLNQYSDLFTSSQHMNELVCGYVQPNVLMGCLGQLRCHCAADLTPSF